MEGNLHPPHVALLSAPGMGHLIPLTELAKLLVSRHGFSVTFITYPGPSSAAENSLLSSLPAGISSLQLPPVSLSDLPADAITETRLFRVATRSIPALRRVLDALKTTTRLVAFVADVFGGDSFLVARELGIKPYMFCPSNLHFLSFVFHLPELAATTTCEYRDLPEPVKLPGCVPFAGVDLLHPLQDRLNEGHDCVVYLAGRFREPDGILVNSFEEMEQSASEVLKQTEPGRPPVYLIGPIIQTGGSSAGDDSGCLKWLDEQPSSSVLFVSFGSGGTLTSEQMAELALGLEMSGQRFLWVVREPSEADAGMSYLTAVNGVDPLGYLPEGFVERARKVGMVVPSWAPQVRVLEHEATGGFLSHCGWNSTLESVIHGVPMIAWPLYAEQRTNAALLEEGARVALRPKARADGVYGREEIARVVKELMVGEEGKKLRRRARELQEAAARAVEQEGSARRALGDAVSKWSGSSSV